MMETAALLLLAAINGFYIPLEKPTIAILLIVSGIMAFSLLRWRLDDRVVERLLKFIMYGLFSMLCIQYPFNDRALIKSIFLFSFIHLAYLFFYAVEQINTGLMSIDDTMDFSYTSLIYLFASAYIAEDCNEKFFSRLVAFAVSVAFIYFLVGVSVNRGALIAVSCFFVLRFVAKLKSERLRIVLFICTIIFSFIVYLNLVSILKSVDSFTRSCGVIIKPIQKTIQQMEYTDSMISGREHHYAVAIQMIKDSWAFPNGVASFDIVKGIYYPHNIFLEAGIELGFLGFILVTIVILRACYCIIFLQPERKNLILIFFCLSIPRLMVSSSYWENSFIWPMMVLLWTQDQSSAY